MSIHLYAVMTLDGKIALHERDPLRWSSREDKDFLLEEMKRFNLAFVGRATYDVSRSFFADKTCVVFSRSVNELTQRGEHLYFSNLDHFDPKRFCQKMGVNQAVVLGGSYIYSYFLKMGWVDELHLTLEPLLFGHGIPWLSQREVNQQYQLSHMRQLNDRGTLLLEYCREGTFEVATDQS